MTCDTDWIVGPLIMFNDIIEIADLFSFRLTFRKLFQRYHTLFLFYICIRVFSGLGVGLLVKDTKLTSRTSVKL